VNSHYPFVIADIKPENVLVSIPHVEWAIRAALSTSPPPSSRLVKIPKKKVKKGREQPRRNSSDPQPSSAGSAAASPETSPADCVRITTSQPLSHPPSWTFPVRPPPPPPLPEDQVPPLEPPAEEKPTISVGKVVKAAASTAISLLTKQLLAGEQQRQQQLQHQQQHQSEQADCAKCRAASAAENAKNVPVVALPPPLRPEDKKPKIKIADLGRDLFAPCQTQHWPDADLFSKGMVAGAICDIRTTCKHVSRPRLRCMRTAD
jgi:type IV secretory pathway VirB10-like protein